MTAATPHVHEVCGIWSNAPKVADSIIFHFHANRYYSDHLITKRNNYD